MERGHRATIQIDLLGPLRVQLDGTDIDVGGPKAQAILVMLAHHVGEVVRIDTLFEALWGVIVQACFGRLNKVLELQSVDRDAGPAS